MKRLLIILLFPITVYAATPLYGSSTTVVKNWKGEFISEDVLVDDLVVEQADELVSTLEFVDDELISTLEYESNLIELETEQDEE